MKLSGISALKKRAIIMVAIRLCRLIYIRYKHWTKQIPHCLLKGSYGRRIIFENIKRLSEIYIRNSPRRSSFDMSGV